MGRRNAARAADRRIGLPRLGDAPQIVVEIIPSSEAPGGVSGLGTLPLAPAVANAIHAGSASACAPCRSTL